MAADGGLNQPYRQLAAAIILQAVSDIVTGPGKIGTEQVGNYRSALKFIRSAWFEQLAAAIALDPEAIRKALLDKEKRQTVRSKYLARRSLAR